MERESSEFRQIFTYLVERSKEAFEATYPQVARNLSDLLKVDPISFLREVCYNNYQATRYAGVPVFKGIDPKEFATLIIELEPRSQISAIQALRERYLGGRLRRELADELPWIIAVVDAINAAFPDLKPNSSYRLSTLLSRYLQPVLDEVVDQKG
jgi:hypothetical protein